jgi:hypothetical protein
MKDPFDVLFRLDDILTRTNVSYIAACEVVDAFLSIWDLEIDDIEHCCAGILGDAANRMALEMHAGFSRNPTINETVKTVCGTYTFDGRRWKSDSEQK